MNGSMNTKIHYLYRDADNYKVHNSCVIKGVLTPEQINVILSCCDAGEYFIPNQVGLPERKFEKIDPQVDHCWFELTRDDFEYTDQPANVSESITPREYADLLFDGIGAALVFNFKRLKREEFDGLKPKIDWSVVERFSFPAPFEDQQYIGDEGKIHVYSWDGRQETTLVWTF